MSVSLKASMTLEDIKAVVQMAIDYDGPIKYNNIWLHGIGAILVLFSCCWYVQAQNHLLWPYYPKQFNGLAPFAIVSTPAFVGMLLIVIANSRRSSLNRLSQAIHAKAGFMEFGLKEVKAPVAKYVKSNYCEFYRGNHKRYFETCYSGSYSGDVHTFTYTLYHFHYIDQETDHSSNSNDSNIPKTVDTHYDRYGIIVDTSFHEGILICSSRPRKTYKKETNSSSVSFNKLFDVTTEDEFQAAKLLKPAVVVYLEDAAKEFTKLNLEHTRDKKLCISFDNNPTALSKRLPGIDDPSAMMIVLRNGESFPHLSKALKVAHNILRLTDNNFKKY